MNKAVITIIVIAVVGVGGYFIFKKAPEQTETTTPLAPIVEGEIVTYTDAGYSPSSLEIKAGDTVVFKNESSRAMWPASAMHPTHADYPTTGGCLGSAFDACQGVQPGDSWSFQLDIAGAWKYHDHLSPSHFGIITVE